MNLATAMKQVDKTQQDLGIANISHYSNSDVQYAVGTTKFTETKMSYVQFYRDNYWEPHKRKPISIPATGRKSAYQLQFKKSVLYDVIARVASVKCDLCQADYLKVDRLTLSKSRACQIQAIRLEATLSELRHVDVTDQLRADSCQLAGTIQARGVTLSDCTCSDISYIECREFHAFRTTMDAYALGRVPYGSLQDSTIYVTRAKKPCIANSRIMSVSGVGRAGSSHLTAFVAAYQGKQQLMLVTGCWSGSAAELRKHIQDSCYDKTYPKSARLYRLAIKTFTQAFKDGEFEV